MRLIWVLALLLAACDNRVSLQLASSGSLDVQDVKLAVSQVRLRDEGGNVTVLPSADTELHDLADYDTGAELTLLSDEGIPAGHYTGVSVLFAAAGAQVVNSSGQAFPIAVQSDPPYAPVDFTVSRRDTASLRANIDLRLSLSDRSASSGSWQLVTNLHVVDLSKSATVGGAISAAVRNSSACLQGRAQPTGASVYAYPQSDLTPYDESQNASPHPVGTVTVTWNGDSTGSYRFAHLAPGSYTLALSCVASQDDPVDDQDLPFAASASFPLDDGESATVDLD